MSEPQPRTPVDYGSGAPAWYCCTHCGAEGVRLYRRYERFADETELLCTKCTLADQERDAPDNHFGYSIGWCVAAVPTEDGVAFWAYISVPQSGVDWWNRLPVESQ